MREAIVFELEEGVTPVTLELRRDDISLSPVAFSSPRYFDTQYCSTFRPNTVCICVSNIFYCISLILS